MALLPLVLMAHPSAWFVEQLPGERQNPLASSPPSCRFCGWSAPGWLETFHLNGDHGDASPGNLVLACVLCHLTQHLDRIKTDREACLIWLPEMSQAAVVALARRIHIAFARNGEPPDLSRPPRHYDPELAAAYSAYCALLDRRPALEARLGTGAPADLGAAILQYGIARHGKRAHLLKGVRLLPRGHLYRDGTDIYLDLLAVAEGGQFPTA